MTTSALSRARYFLALVIVPGLVLGMASTADAAAPKRTPNPVIVSGPTGFVASRTATFAFTDPQAGSAFSCSLDAGSFAACVSPKSYTGLSEAAHTFRVRATASGMRVSGTVSRSWTVDVTAPAAPTVSQPASPTNQTPVSISFSSASTDVTGYQCSLDGAAASACTSPASVGPAADGPHTFAVTAVDHAGNKSATRSVLWYRDSSTPTPVVNSGPASSTAATTASFAFASAENGVSFTCQLDGGAFSACSSGVLFSGLAMATHSFVVRATDGAGNTADSAPWSWSVVASPPSDLTWSDPATLPAGITHLTTAHLAFSVSGSPTLTCLVDGTAQPTCVSPLDLSGLTDGLHTVDVIADQGLPTQVTVRYAWTVDTVAPAPATILAPTGFVASTSAAVTVHPSSLTDTLACTFDGSPLACSAPVSLTGLAQGAHLVQATMTDLAGNTSTSSAGWTVDTVAPSSTITVPASITSPARVVFPEPVHGLGTTSPVVRTSAGAAVGVRLSCYTGTSVATSCATGLVRTAWLTPAAPLVPGEHYVVLVNPAGSATVVDQAGNRAIARSAPFRAALVQQENSPAVHQTWQRVATASALGGSYVTEHRGGAAAVYTLPGTSLTWYTVTGPSFGVARVYVDGVLKATTNNYATSTHYRVARTISGLANQSHTLSIMVTGLKGSTHGTDSLVAVDALRYGTTTLVTPNLVTTWRYVGTASAWGGRYVLTDLRADTVWMTFRGTGLVWYATTGTAYGKASVYIDGVLVRTIDTYASATHYRVGYGFSGLADRRHTVLVVVQGTHRAGARGSYVAVDGFIVH